MKKLIVAVVLATVVAAPAFARQPSAKADSGNIAGAFSARSQVAPRHSHGVRQPRGHDAYGQRWPGAAYDENGYYIDPNSPGRW
jgi:Ni/Co efflux regulator RcnB